MDIPKTIAIIGGTGKMGSMFRRAFESEDIDVIVTGRTTKYSNIDATKLADIVIVTVPINKTVDTIEEIIPYVKKGCMITDFTSVKVNPVKAMLKSQNDVEIIGGHPLFGPSVDFKGQNFILCKERIGKYYEWYKSFLEKIGLKIIEMTADEHDKNMAVIQCLTHFSNISLGFALSNMGYDIEQAEQISTPVYLMRLYGVGRILAQDAQLYSDIQIHNPYSKEVAKEYLKSVQQLTDSILSENDNEFVNIFNQSSEYFGDMKKKSMDVTNKLIKEMSR